MNRHGYIRTSVCALLAVIAGLAALSAVAFAQGTSTSENGIANGLRSGSNLPKIEQRHAVVGKKQKNKKARHHAGHGHHVKGKPSGGNGVSTPGTGTGGQESSGAGTTTPGTGNGSGKKPPTTPTKPTTPPVTETPTTPPV